MKLEVVNCLTMAYLKHGLIFCILEGWLSLIRRSFTSDNNYSQCCNYPACIKRRPNERNIGCTNVGSNVASNVAFVWPPLKCININNPFIYNDHQITWRNYNAISD